MLKYCWGIDDDDDDNNTTDKGQNEKIPYYTFIF